MSQKEKIFVLDNYDSFTYNTIYFIRLLYAHIVIVSRNSSIDLEEIDAYNKILLSPGPGLPYEAHILKPLIKYYAAVKKILGVCLGQQAIADVFGGKLINPYPENLVHGIACKITIVDGEEKIFDNFPTFMFVGLYNSWIVSECHFPNELKITARGSKGEIMALRHKYYDVIGVQFHPESILTNNGINIIYNWLISQK